MRVSIFLLSLVAGLNQPTLGQTKWVNIGPAEEEAVIAKAVVLRARGLEKVLGIAFDKDWTPKISLEWGLRGIEGKYVAEEQTIKFPMSLMSELTVKFKTPLRLLDPVTLAKDSDFAELADHELGHLYMDQVSRRTRYQPWFTVKQFYDLSPEEALGLNILSEGVATFFQRVSFPRESYLVTSQAFPKDAERWAYTYEMVTADGGLWLVRDILTKRVDQGLAWLVSHPLVASHQNLRQAAIEYRQQALAELAKHQTSSRPS